MGDSCTYGMGVSIDDTWPSRLARTYGHDAINASSPGYTTYQGLLYHDDRCRDLDADVIVIEYGPNDVGTWASPQDGELLCLTDRERARHVSYTSGRSGSRLIDWLRSLTLPSPEDVQGLSPTVKIARVPLDEFRENLVALASKAPVAVFLVWPLRSQLDPLSPERNLSMDRFAAYQKAIREMAGSGHAVVDVVELFRNSGLPPGDLFVDTVHATPRGCQIIADAVQKRIAEARPRRQRR